MGANPPIKRVQFPAGPPLQRCKSGIGKSFACPHCLVGSSLRACITVRISQPEFEPLAEPKSPISRLLLVNASEPCQRFR